MKNESCLPNIRACYAVFPSLRIILICVLFSSICVDVLAQAELLMDVNENEEDTYNEFSNLRDGHGKAYYVSEQQHLWVHYFNADGEDVTEKLASFVYIDQLVMVGGILYFSAGDGRHGRELWKSDGTRGGTVMVKDIWPGARSGAPLMLTDVKGQLYFTATNNLHGRELWKSNGSSAGTTMVKDIFPALKSSNPAYLTNVNGIVYFSATDGGHGNELWRSDGTAMGTTLVKDIKTAPAVGSVPQQITNVDGTVYFTAAEDATGRELYKSNGTAQGTIRVKDIRPGRSSSGIDNMTAVGSVLFFSANDGQYGHELWKSTGTAAGTVLVKDMTPGFEGSHGEYASSFRMTNFKNISGTLFFTAYKDDDYYIWTSNGTSGGTVARYLASGPGRLQPRPIFTEMNGMVFFFNLTESDYWYSLFKTDLKASLPEPVLVLELANDAQTPYYPEMVVVTNPRYGNNYLYLNGTVGVVAGGGSITMLISDGSDYTGFNWQEVGMDPYVATASSNPHNYIDFKGNMAFISRFTFYDSDGIFITDGTSAGTKVLVGFTWEGSALIATNKFIYGFGRHEMEIYRTSEDYPGPFGYTAWYSPGLPAQNLTAVGEDIFFTNTNGELWMINSDSAGFDFEGKGLTLLNTIHTMSDLKALGTNLIFRVKTATNGEELWRSNGTTSGTYRYKTVRTKEAVAPLVSPSATIRNSHYFVANDGIHGNEVWRTQGTGSSTYMLADLNTSDPILANGAEYDISCLVAFRDSLYVSAIDNAGVWSLFKCKGNARATLSKVADMNAVKMMVPAGNTLYLFAYGPDQRTGLDLWKTNGTTGGTTLVKELPASDSIQYYVWDDILYFNLNNGSSLWRSDGTECGTYSFDTGVDSFNLTGIGSTLIFNGYTRKLGMEPYIYNTALIPDAPCNSAIAQASSNEDHSAGYPNPFTDEFLLRVPGVDNELVNVAITTINGYPVQKLEMIEANTEHHLGKAWAPGMYILKVQRGKDIWSSIIVKK